jgi:hypothetical protein
MTNPAGRPTKLTDEVQETIVSNLSSCAHRSIAAGCAGIGTRTLVTWMRNGKERPKSRFGKFRRAILEAEKRAEMRLAALIVRAAANDPKQAQWMLSHRFPKRWAEKTRLELERTPPRIQVTVEEARAELEARVLRVIAAKRTKEALDQKLLSRQPAD